MGLHHQNDRGPRNPRSSNEQHDRGYDRDRNAQRFDRPEHRTEGGFEQPGYESNDIRVHERGATFNGPGSRYGGQGYMGGSQSFEPGHEGFDEPSYATDRGFRQAGQQYRGAPYGESYGDRSLRNQNNNPDSEWRSRNTSGSNYGSGNPYEENHGGFGRESTRSDVDRGSRGEAFQSPYGYQQYGGRMGERGGVGFQTRGDQMGMRNRFDSHETSSDRFRDEDTGGEHRGRGPKGFQRSDERIKERVCEALEEHARIDASEIDVDVKGGEITLTGTVTTRDQKRLAEDILEHLPGVKEIHNQLRLQRESTSSSSSLTPGSNDKAGMGRAQTSGKSDIGATKH
jgi:osmotically-inducible protein OsmY